MSKYVVNITIPIDEGGVQREYEQFFTIESDLDEDELCDSICDSMQIHVTRSDDEAEDEDQELSNAEIQKRYNSLRDGSESSAPNKTLQQVYDSIRKRKMGNVCVK